MPGGSDVPRCEPTSQAVKKTIFSSACCGFIGPLAIRDRDPRRR